MKDSLDVAFQGMKDSVYPPVLRPGSYASTWQYFKGMAIKTQLNKRFLHIICKGALGDGYYLKEFEYRSLKNDTEFEESAFGLNQEPVDDSHKRSEQVKLS